jgi:hypothetical protein
LSHSFGNLLSGFGNFFTEEKKALGRRSQVRRNANYTLYYFPPFIAIFFKALLKRPARLGDAEGDLEFQPRGFLLPKRSACLVAT